jgi:hypothetical protein
VERRTNLRLAGATRDGEGGHQCLQNEEKAHPILPVAVVQKPPETTDRMVNRP